MLKKYLFFLVFLCSFVGCGNIDNLTTVSGQQETDARLLYRGLLYGNLEQIERHTDRKFFEQIKDTPNFLKDVQNLIPKTDNFQAETLSTKFNINFPKIWEKKLIITYIYKYDSKRLLYTVFFDNKTKKIIDISISEIVE